MAKNNNYNTKARAEKEARKAAERKKQQIKTAVTAIIIILLIGAIIGGGIALILEATLGEDYCVAYENREVSEEDAVYLELKVKGYKDPIILLLDRSNATKTVDNFVSLVEKGFYDGLTFHRVIKDFMIQGGDDSHLPADQQASSIKGEFLSNGIYNDIEHKRGVISMARTDDPDSASSGFFICDADSSHLDGEYAAFGYVIDGLNTVDRIVRRTVRFTGDNGQISKKSRQAVIEYIKILEDYEAK